MNEESKLVQQLNTFAAAFLRAMDGRDLCRGEVAFYQTHPEEWHWRKFHLLMLATSELRKMQGTIVEFAFSHATIMPAKELSRVIGSCIHLKRILRDAVDCWETDRDLAYNRFGCRFAFPAPRSDAIESEG